MPYARTDPSPTPPLMPSLPVCLRFLARPRRLTRF
jgi:hypothetical protein